MGTEIRTTYFVKKVLPITSYVATLNYSARRHEPPYLLDSNSKDGYHTAIRFHLLMPIFVLPLAHSHWMSLVTWTDLSNGHIDEHAIKDGESATSV